jgi:hypothetical protein
VIWVEDDEITVEVGRIYHAHFYDNSVANVYLPGGKFVRVPGWWEYTVEELAKRMAQSAANYIQEVVSDPKLFEMEWHGDWIASASSIHLDNGMPPRKVLPEGIRRERYRWSGPVQPTDSTEGS